MSEQQAASERAFSGIAWGAPLPAPAKINLFLHVVGRRDDGYHLLQTAFRMVDRCDTLRLTPRDDGRVCQATPIAGVPEDTDLCVRAARLLQAHAGVTQGVSIALEKCLPMGGGLGGGSSDAATVLWALNELWGVHLPKSELMALGLRLGADVPFFLFGESAFAQGVGEDLQALNLAPAWYLILEPGVSVPTAEIFSKKSLTRDTPATTIAAFPAADVEISFGRNDLEPVACQLYPQVAAALYWLKQHKSARMSGSGASVFASFATKNEALDVLANVPTSWKAWVAQGLDKHPLAG